MATYTITQPYYSAPDNSTVDCMWLNPTYGLIPFTASPVDVTVYGPEIYAQCVAGDHGPVLSYAATHYYSTAPETLGALVVAPTGVQPADTTTDPPVSYGYGGISLWWYDAENTWIASYFNPNEYTTVPAAKTWQIDQTKYYGAVAVNDQLRGYSEVQIRTAPDINALITFDYAPLTIGDYQTFIDGQVATQTATISALTTLDQLYAFNASTLDIVP